jgi:hypothetical protein
MYFRETESLLRLRLLLNPLFIFVSPFPLLACPKRVWGSARQLVANSISLC